MGIAAAPLQGLVQTIFEQAAAPLPRRRPWPIT